MGGCLRRGAKIMDWARWAIFGLVATSLLTGVMIMAQLAAVAIFCLGGFDAGRSC